MLDVSKLFTEVWYVIDSQSTPLCWTIAQCLPCAHLADLNLLFGRSTKKFEDEDLPEILRPVQKLSSNDSQLRDNENAVATVDQSISG